MLTTKQDFNVFKDVDLETLAEKATTAQVREWCAEILTARRQSRAKQLGTAISQWQHRGYQLEIGNTITLFGARVCFIKQGGLTIAKAVGRDKKAAFLAATRKIDYMVDELER